MNLFKIAGTALFRRWKVGEIAAIKEVAESSGMVWVIEGVMRRIYKPTLVESW